VGGVGYELGNLRVGGWTLHFNLTITQMLLSKYCKFCTWMWIGRSSPFPATHDEAL